MPANVRNNGPPPAAARHRLAQYFLSSRGLLSRGHTAIYYFSVCSSCCLSSYFFALYCRTVAHQHSLLFPPILLFPVLSFVFDFDLITHPNTDMPTFVLPIQRRTQHRDRQNPSISSLCYRKQGIWLGTCIKNKKENIPLPGWGDTKR